MLQRRYEEHLDYGRVQNRSLANHVDKPAVLLKTIQYVYAKIKEDHTTLT